MEEIASRFSRSVSKGVTPRGKRHLTWCELTGYILGQDRTSCGLADASASAGRLLLPLGSSAGIPIGPTPGDETASKSLTLHAQSTTVISTRHDARVTRTEFSSGRWVDAVQYSATGSLCSTVIFSLLSSPYNSTVDTFSMLF